MDFNREWTKFALEAEIETYGESRIAAEHNSMVKFLEQDKAYLTSQLAEAKEKIVEIDAENGELKCKLKEAREEIARLNAHAVDVYNEQRKAYIIQQAEIARLRKALEEIRIYCGDRHRVMMLGVQGFNTVDEIAKAALEASDG